MSISLLLEKYDVSTEEGLQKALSEIEREEVEVDEALSGVMSRACNLEGRLRTASQMYTKLGEVKNDSQASAEMVEKTAALARDVSAKVRQLDLARTRVAECQRRVHDLIDLQLCSAGVEAAIKAHDYETGAAHVSRFLSMDPGSVAAAQARGEADPRDAMMRAANTLREHLVRKFEEAAQKDDEASIERLFGLFPQIGRAEEGVELVARHLARRAEGELLRAGRLPHARPDAAVFADGVTRVVEGGAAALQRAARLGAAAPGLLPRALAVLQPQVCRAVRRVYAEMVSCRRLGQRGRDPLEAEPVLAELALAHSRIQLYFKFLRRKAEADASPLDDVKKQAALREMDKIIAECELMRTAQDILGHYLDLERYFLEESVQKALRLGGPAAGATSSTLVDDVFYIARKVIRRSMSTGSVDGACAVLNEVGAVLEREVGGALRRWLRTPPPDPLPFPPPPGAAPPSAAALATPSSLHQRLNRDVDAQKLLFLAHMNEAENGAEWAERLAAEACAEGEGLVGGAAERDKLASCAAGLAGAAAALRAARDCARAALRAALAPRAQHWAYYLVAPAHDADEMEEESDADALPQALDQFSETARGLVPGPALLELLAGFVADVSRRALARLLQHSYSRESGLLVERRARRLAAWARAAGAVGGGAGGGGGGGGGAREAAGRLVQAAALLSLERASHAGDALAPTPLLSPAQAKDVLARRNDFKMEEIKRLKL